MGAVAFAQIPVALVWGTGSKFYIERFFRVKLTEEQRMLKEAFEKYLSPQMLEKLTEDGFQMKFGGEKVPCAMMFTDLESFTNMCEKVGDPGKIVEALSGYFERTTGHIFDHEGVVIKFIGDAVNLSARLEGLNKAFGTRILISEDVRCHLGDEFVTRKVGAFKVKGRKEPTVAHELLGPRADVEVPSWLAVYQEALAALEKDDFENAQRLFAETNAMRGESGDGPSRFYLALLARGAEIKGGVFEMSEK